MDRRVHPVRPGQGNTAGTARQEPEVGGVPALTPDDPSGTPAPARPAHRRAFQAHPIPAVVGRQWHGQADGAGGQTVLLPQAAVQNPWPVVADDADRRLLEHGWMKAPKQPWAGGHPPQKPQRAVRGPVVFTL